jgi:23S rRNA pseudouridine955/2504/2580 synthase
MKQEIIIKKNDADQRIDKFMTKAFPNLPQSMLYRAIRTKDIKINKKRCEPSSKLSEGDVLTVFLKDDFLQKKPEEYDFLKAPVKLEVVYEDNNLIILDKKPGLIVHPDEDYHFDSLISRIQHYLYDKGEYDPSKENSFVPALINRIDRNTGGLVLAAKNSETLRIMNLKFKNRELEKHYLCLVIGIMPKKSDILTGYLEKDEKNKRVYITDHRTSETKTIKTKYTVIEARNNFSLLDIDLLTGRTHQIRAHLASVGHPIAGDGKYGLNSINKKIGFPYQALYANSIRFDFKTDAGPLNYLNNRTFSVSNIWFLNDFYKWN